MFWLDSSFNPLSIHTLGLKNQAEKKMNLMIGLFYPSLNPNPRNPPIKAFVFSLLMFWLSPSIRLPKGKVEEVKAQGREFFDAQYCSR